MKTCLLQDWVTVNAADGQTVPQSAHQYIDLGQFEDLVFYLDVRQFENAPILSYETAPSRQDSSFLPMIAPIAISAVGVRVDRAMFSTAAVPPARYVRWKITTVGGTWNMTFRIWMTAYRFC